MVVRVVEWWFRLVRVVEWWWSELVTVVELVRRERKKFSFFFFLISVKFLGSVKMIDCVILTALTAFIGLLTEPLD
jgi:hypothetical protein